MRSWLIGVLSVASLCGGAGSGDAAELHARLSKATPSGAGDAIGTLTIADGASGAQVRTALSGLPVGPHGFHIHENGSCEPTIANGQPVPAGGAGGHFDPQKTGKHAGPEGGGHLGDLLLLQVGADGAANQILAAPHIKNVAALRGKTVMIHAGGDNYSDQPAPLGGGGARIACGVLE